MGRMVCTEPQYLHKGALYLYCESTSAKLSVDSCAHVWHLILCTATKTRIKCKALLTLHRIAENSQLLYDDMRQSSVSHYTELLSRNVKSTAGIPLLKLSLIN